MARGGWRQCRKALSAEAESGNFPTAYRPVAGDRVTIAGRWIFDCGHNPRTEIHPAAIVASEHEEWRADVAGGAQQVNVLQVWMNGAPGVVDVPLAPFDMQADFPASPASQPLTPTVQVVQGPANSVRWTIDRATEIGSTAQAAVHFTPPAPQGAAYFELLLGYDVQGRFQQLAGRFHIWSPSTISPSTTTCAMQHAILQVSPWAWLSHRSVSPVVGAGSCRRLLNHNWRSLLEGCAGGQWPNLFPRRCACCPAAGIR